MVVFAEIITNDSLLLVWMSPQTSQREAGFAVSDHIAHREHCPSHAAYDGNSVRFSVRIGRWRLTVEFSAAGACCGMFPKPRLAGECSANCGASLVLCSELSAPVASRPATPPVESQTLSLISHCVFEATTSSPPPT